GLDTICFDKTGTLTAPGNELTVELQPAAAAAGLDEPSVRAIAAALGSASTHPLAAALAAHAAVAAEAPSFVHVRETPGRGVEASTADGRTYRLGSAPWATAGAIGSVASDGPEAWLAGPDGAL